MKKTFLIAIVAGLAGCSEKPAVGTVAAAEPAKALTSPAVPVAEQVKPVVEVEQPSEEQALAQRVASALEDAKLHGIDIGVASGIVTLWGTVSSASERTRAARIARKLEGVKSVENKLVVVTGS